MRHPCEPRHHGRLEVLRRTTLVRPGAEDHHSLQREVHILRCLLRWLPLSRFKAEILNTSSSGRLASASSSSDCIARRGPPTLPKERSIDSAISSPACNATQSRRPSHPRVRAQSSQPPPPPPRQSAPLAARRRHPPFPRTPPRCRPRCSAAGHLVDNGSRQPAILCGTCRGTSAQVVLHPHVRGRPARRRGARLRAPAQARLQLLADLRRR